MTVRRVVDRRSVFCWLPGQFGAQLQVLPADFPAHDAVWTIPTGGQPLLSAHGLDAGWHPLSHYKSVFSIVETWFKDIYICSFLSMSFTVSFL